MNKILSTLVFTLLLFLVCGGIAQATYYHFEDYRQDDVVFTGVYTSSWTFDLDADNLSLWDISAVPLANRGADWEKYPDLIGHMDALDDLHRAYLTMRFCGANGDVADMLFDDVLFWNDKTLSTGGTGTIDVKTQLYDDHQLKVTITSVSGDGFKVDWMNLSGCYETASSSVPEPGTLILLGMGLALLPFLSRKKS